MKKIIVISDSFKGTISSSEICRMAAESVPRFFPNCELITLPVADGGEGTAECFIQSAGATAVTVPTTGPYGEPISAVYAHMGDKAIIEMACAAGLPMVGERRDPSRTTTYGVGTVIRHAVASGCREILLGLGGSATNDAGCGCAAALGVKFYDINGTDFVPTGSTLEKIHHIALADCRALLSSVSITVMCDVENPLYGLNGAAHIFGPQKGADASMVASLDNGLKAFDRLLQQELGLSVADLPGAGAAGGMGGGCVALLGATLKSGIESILDMVEFDSLLDGADLVITGEGRIDSQSVQGKVISGIAGRTAPRNIPLVAIVGCIDESATLAYELGVTAMFGIDREARAFADYAPQSADMYQKTLEDILRLIKAVR